MPFAARGAFTVVVVLQPILQENMKQCIVWIIKGKVDTSFFKGKLGTVFTKEAMQAKQNQHETQNKVLKNHVFPEFHLPLPSSFPVLLFL